jgi:DNA-binding transcriptional ArsR family regulator
MPAAANKVFAALADPTRRAIFERLARNGELTVRAPTDKAGVSQPGVSNHLGILKLAGLVRDRHEGRQTHYSARPQGLGGPSIFMRANKIDQKALKAPIRVAVALRQVG